MRYSLVVPVDDATSDGIRFYFSFRSPYAWLAAECLDAEFGGLGVPIESVPVYPTEGLFPNDPVGLPNKVAHMVQDVVRLTRERGLTLRFPSAGDPDWSLSHAAYLGAEREGVGHPFMLEVFRRRWSEGLDLGEDAVLAEAAERAGLDPEKILACAHDVALREQAAGAWAEAIDRDRIFGVPSFVYKERLYWGQDRMRFVRQAVERKSAASQGSLPLEA